MKINNSYECSNSECPQLVRKCNDRGNANGSIVCNNCLRIPSACYTSTVIFTSNADEQLTFQPQYPKPITQILKATLTTNELENLNFYEQNYELVGQWILGPNSKKEVLGDASHRVCRFCNREAPTTSFKNEAHVIPEMLGNKTLFSTYECDDCNAAFGAGIENDLGNWTKPIRTLLRIRGKRGVPTMKKVDDKTNWRIEYERDQLQITARESDLIYKLDEDNKQVIFSLPRDPYTPVGVLKAFIKIALTLIPEKELDNFRELLAWIQEIEHSIPLDDLTVIHTFQPGPMPNDIIRTAILRRRPRGKGEHMHNYPYAIFILSYGNDTFQIPLPSEKMDNFLEKRSIKMVPFPTPNHVDLGQYGNRIATSLNLLGTQRIKGEMHDMSMGYDELIPVDLPENA